MQQSLLFRCPHTFVHIMFTCLLSAYIEYTAHSAHRGHAKHKYIHHCAQIVFTLIEKLTTCTANKASRVRIKKKKKGVREEHRGLFNHCRFHFILFTLGEGTLQKVACYHRGTRICAHRSRGVRSPRVFLTADCTVAALFAFN